MGLIRSIPVPGLLQPLRQGQFALLWAGQLISSLGDGAFIAVLTWTVYALGGSPAAAGYVLMAASIPQLVLMLAGGVVGDRFSRRSVIFVSDTIASLSVGTAAVLAASGRLTVPALMVLSAVFGTVSAFFLPAYRPLIPEIVPEDRLQTVNALQAVTLNTAQIVGPSLGAGLYSVGRAAAAFGFDALTFLVAAGASLLLRIPRRRVDMPSSVWTDVREGWHYVRKTTWLWLSIVLASAYHLVAGGPFFVLLPLVLRNLHLSVAFMGLTLSLMGIAGVAGNLILSQIPILRHRGLLLYGGWSTLGIADLLVGVANSYPLIAVSAVLVGFGLGAETIWSTLVQQRVPTGYQSRVVSLDYLGSFAFRPLGLAGAGILASVIGPRPILIIGGVIGFGLFALGALTPAIRHLD